MSEKVLITGGAGFIGYHLAAHLLDKGYQVHLVDNMARGVQDDDLKALLTRPGISFETVDVLSPTGMDGQADDYTYVIHLAAIIGVVHVLNRPYEVLRDNVAMLANMIEFAKRQKAMKRFMFASTSEIYAGTLMHFDLPIPTPESTPLAILPLEHPRTSYMLSKIYGEAMCQHSGVPFTIIRPHNIYGPRMGMAHVIPEQLRKMHEAAAGDSIEVFSMDHRRSFCYVSDAVEMITRMLERDSCENQALNLGREAPEVTIQTVAEACRSAVGKALELDGQPAQPGSPARRAPDMGLTTELTGYAALVDLAEGVGLTYDWYRERIFEGDSITAK